MPHSTLWQSSSAFDAVSNNISFSNDLPTPAQSPPPPPQPEDTKGENIHIAGTCSCVHEDTTPLGHFRRRQSQQSTLAKYAMATNVKQGEDMRRSNSDEGRNINENDVETLRSSLDRALSPTLEKRRLAVPEEQAENDPPEHTAPAPLQPRPRPSVAENSAMAHALNGKFPDGSRNMGATSTMALNDTPAATAPASPRMYGNTPQPAHELAANLYLSPPLRQMSGTSTPRARPTTLDIPGLTKSKVSPDGRIAQRDVGAKLVIVMVGLPARGKSYITKKLARYLNWLQHDTRIFNVGERRRVAAGGPNTLEKTQSQQTREGHRPSMPPGVQSGIVDQNALSKQMSNDVQPASVAQILLNGETKIEPPTPPRRAAATTAPELPSKHKDDDQDQDPENMPVELLESRFPEMVEAQKEQEEASQLPETEAMDQSASFFDPKNKKAALIREQLAMNTLDELLDYILDQNGSVGILDATNSTLERRKMVMRHIRERAGPELNVLFLESRCLDQDLLEGNMRLKLGGPDYKDMDPQVALADFKKRIAVYETAYVPLGEYEERNHMPYIQMIDVGRKIISHQIRGFLSAQANYYLLNFNLAPRQIWITRHGLSLDNLSGKIGGDSDLSPEGHQYAKSLARFMDKQRQEWDTRQFANAQNTHFPPQPGDATPPNPHYNPQSPSASSDSSNAITSYESKPFCVWTSMLKRSIQTAQFFNDDEYDTKQMRMLDELNAGVMEGLTYNCISSQYPEEFKSRKQDKLHYRYPGPGGEGYLDIINRLRPVIVELERMEDHVLLVGHRSVARVLLAYFRGLKREEVADLDVPIGMLYCLEPKPYGVDFKAYKWHKQDEWFYEQPDFQLVRAVDDMQ